MTITSWWDALGKPVPQENLEATLALLIENEYPRWQSEIVLNIVASEIRNDNPDRAQRVMRSFVSDKDIGGRGNETLVLRALATMTAPQ